MLTKTLARARERARKAVVRKGYAVTVTSKSIGSCEKDIEGYYMVRWAVTGYTGSHIFEIPKSPFTAQIMHSHAKAWE